MEFAYLLLGGASCLRCPHGFYKALFMDTDELRTVTFVVKRVANYWAVLDRQGLVCGSIKDKLVGLSQADELPVCVEDVVYLQDHWAPTLRKCVASIFSAKDHGAKSNNAVLASRLDNQALIDWNRKLVSMSCSLRKREFYQDCSDSKTYKRHTWRQSLGVMKQTVDYKQREAADGKDKWQRWCDTVRSNIARRARIKLANDQC
jgi:hypothetical protein